MPSIGLTVENKEGERMLYSVMFTEMDANPVRLSLFDDRIIHIWESTATTGEELREALLAKLRELELTLIQANRIEVDQITLDWFARLRQ